MTKLVIGSCSVVIATVVLFSCHKEQIKTKPADLPQQQQTSYQSGDTLFLINEKRDTLKIVSDPQSGYVVENNQIVMLDPVTRSSSNDTLSIRGTDGVLVIKQSDLLSLTDAQLNMDWSAWPAAVLSKNLGIIDLDNTPKRGCLSWNIGWNSSYWPWMGEKIETGTWPLGTSGAQWSAGLTIVELKLNSFGKWCDNGFLIDFGGSGAAKPNIWFGREIGLKTSHGSKMWNVKAKAGITTEGQVGLAGKASLKFGGDYEHSHLLDIALFGQGNVTMAASFSAKGVVPLTANAGNLDVELQPIAGTIGAYVQVAYAIGARHVSTEGRQDLKCKYGLYGRLFSKFKFKYGNNNWETTVVWFERTLATMDLRNPRRFKAGSYVPAVPLQEDMRDHPDPN